MKCILIILVAVFCCTLSGFVNGMSDIDMEFTHPTVNQTLYYIRQDGNAEEVDCVSWYGCWNGYCWVGCCFNDCLDPNGDKIQHGDWCYSASPDAKVNAYQKCKTKSDCSNCWTCTGGCDAAWSF